MDKIHIIYNIESKPWEDVEDRVMWTVASSLGEKKHYAEKKEDTFYR